MGYALSLTDAHGSLHRSSFLSLIVAVGRQSIWVVLPPYKGQPAKRFLFLLATGLTTLEPKINQHDDCVKSWAVKNSTRKTSVES